MKFKLVVSDFDGTLGSVPHVIEPETVEAIKKYVSAGGKFVICSGRGYDNVSIIYKNYGLKGFAVGLQGGIIKDVETKETLFLGGIPTDVVLKVISRIKSFGVQVVAYPETGLLYDEDTEYTRYYRSVLKVEGTFVDNLVDYISKNKLNIIKVNAIAHPEKVAEIIPIIKREFEGELLINSGSSRLMECVHPLCNKGNAVKILAEKFNLDYSEIMAVGDSSNDIELVNGSWHGVAVGDADEALKKVAKEVTVPFSENPIKHLLEIYG